MCNTACLEFGQNFLDESDVKGKDVIELGSLDVNGSLRSYIETMEPKSYTGIDITEGPGVGVVCAAENLDNHFGGRKFDLVVSTEMLEHVRYWRKIISNMKNLLNPDGALLITTRSYGFRYHGYPYDFWRYEVGDMRVLFADLDVERVETDPISPGVFVKARKPDRFIESDLSFYELYSIVKSKRCEDISDPELFIYGKYWKMKLSLKSLWKRIKKIHKGN